MLLIDITRGVSTLTALGMLRFDLQRDHTKEVLRNECQERCLLTELFSCTYTIGKPFHFSKSDLTQ